MTGQGSGRETGPRGTRWESDPIRPHTGPCRKPEHPKLATFKSRSPNHRPLPKPGPPHRSTGALPQNPGVVAFSAPHIS